MYTMPQKFLRHLLSNWNKLQLSWEICQSSVAIKLMFFFQTYVYGLNKLFYYAFMKKEDRPLYSIPGPLRRCRQLFVLSGVRCELSVCIYTLSFLYIEIRVAGKFSN